MKTAMKTTIELTLVLLLTGCGTPTIISQQSQQAADTAFELSRLAFCRGATLGALMRYYGANLQQFDKHLKVCGWKPE